MIIIIINIYNITKYLIIFLLFTNELSPVEHLKKIDK